MVINKELLSSNAASLGVDLSEDMLDKFDLLASLLIEQNKTMNLTAITQPNEVVVKHFADSLSLLSAIEVPQGAKVLDLGTGAGFPGLPLLIARPDIRLTMVDSTAKKLAYVASTLDKLSLSAETLHARAEEAARQPELREQFDFATARAVAALPVLAEYCLPFVRVGGVFAAMKGPSEPVEPAEQAIVTLGGGNVQVTDYTLEQAGARRLVQVEKCRPTPEKYPRRSKQIQQKPLG